MTIGIRNSYCSRKSPDRARDLPANVSIYRPARALTLIPCDEPTYTIAGESGDLPCCLIRERLRRSASSHPRRSSTAHGRRPAAPAGDCWRNVPVYSVRLFGALPMRTPRRCHQYIAAVGVFATGGENFRRMMASMPSACLCVSRRSPTSPAAAVAWSEFCARRHSR